MKKETRAGAIAETIGHLAARWERADKRILKQVFPLLARGYPLSVGEIAAAVGIEAGRVDAALREGRAERDAEGRVIELSGLTLLPTVHRVAIDDITLFGCCALMVHQVPILLGRRIEVESVDPISRRVIELSLDPNGVQAGNVREIVCSFVTTTAGGLECDLGASFCSHIRHFSGRESASKFVAGDPRRYVLEIEELHRAARLLYDATWGN